MMEVVADFCLTPVVSGVTASSVAALWWSWGAQPQNARRRPCCLNSLAAALLVSVGSVFESVTAMRRAVDVSGDENPTRYESVVSNECCWAGRKFALSSCR